VKVNILDTEKIYVVHTHGRKTFACSTNFVKNLYVNFPAFLSHCE
jgi:hypothetical protein